MVEQDGINPPLRHHARYLAAIEKEGVRPGKSYDLSPLRALLSTGYPLPIESFHYAYREIKKDLQVASIAGGTDLNGCFALGNPLLPVYAGGTAVSRSGYEGQGL